MSMSRSRFEEQLQAWKDSPVPTDGVNPTDFSVLEGSALWAGSFAAFSCLPLTQQRWEWLCNLLLGPEDLYSLARLPPAERVAKIAGYRQ